MSIYVRSYLGYNIPYKRWEGYRRCLDRVKVLVGARYWEITGWAANFGVYSISFFTRDVTGTVLSFETAAIFYPTL